MRIRTSRRQEIFSEGSRSGNSICEIDIVIISPVEPFFRLVAEITGNLTKTDKQMEEVLGGNMAVARTVIDYGQKDKNPIVS